MKIDLILILIIVLLIIHACFFNQYIEGFADFYSECNLTELMEKAMKNVGINKGEKEGEYYLPCEYNTCEEKVKTFEAVGDEKNPKKLFLIDGCDWPASKIHLWILLKEYYGNDKAASLMPQTYLLDDPEDLEKIKLHYEKNLKKRNNHMYILKNYAQRQEGLKIVQKYEDIMDGYKNGFYLVQDYLYNPFLISNRKINFRYYTLIICRAGKVEGYIHKNGFVYYTPEDYDENDPGFNKHITTGYIDRSIYDNNPLTLDDFRDYLEKLRTGLSKMWDDNVNVLMHNTIKAIETKVCKNKKLQHHTLFQLFGSDVAPTKDLQAKLMEINKGPDLSAKDERDKKVKLGVQEDIFKIIELNDPSRFVRVF
jgi:hypothetical protein